VQVTSFTFAETISSPFLNCTVTSSSSCDKAKLDELGSHFENRRELANHGRFFDVFPALFIHFLLFWHRSERAWLCQNIPEICPHIRSQSVCIHRVMHRIESSERPAIEWLPPVAHTFSPYADSAPKIPIPLHSRHSQSTQVHLPDLLPASELKKQNDAHTSETNPQAAKERVWHPVDACRQYPELSRIVGKEDLTALILTCNLYASTETLSYLGHLHKVLFMEVYMALIDFFIDRTSSPSQSDIEVKKVTTLGLPGTS
jgi:hypothetical protein